MAANGPNEEALEKGIHMGHGKVLYTIKGKRFEVNKRYQVTKVVGNGAYGTVCSAIDTVSKDKVAIKKIARVFDDLVDGKRILREMKLLRTMHHTNLIRLRSFLRPLQEAKFDDLYLVTDLFDTDLYRIIRSKQQLTNEHIQYFLVQAFRGLHYLHSAKVIHRDMKPSNLLVNADCSLAICDLGLARGEDRNSEEMTEYVVTRWYRPPELLALSTQYSTAVDIWSVGLILAEILVGRTLLPGKDYIAQLMLVIDLLGTPSDEEMEMFSTEARNFIKSQPKKEGRSFENLFPTATPDAIDLLRKLLAFAPQNRPTTREVLDHPYFASLRDPSEESTADNPFEWTYGEEFTEPQLRAAMWTEILACSEDNE